MTQESNGGAEDLGGGAGVVASFPARRIRPWARWVRVTGLGRVVGGVLLGPSLNLDQYAMPGTDFVGCAPSPPVGPHPRTGCSWAMSRRRCWATISDGLDPLDREGWDPWLAFLAEAAAEWTADAGGGR